MKATVHGVGINDSGYVVQKKETIRGIDGKWKQRLVWVCPYYRAWQNMLGRAYSKSFQEKQPTYIGCSVSEEWKTFSNFRKWMLAQDWEGKQLDKDLLVEGNKVYSEETCVFVSRAVNNFMIDSDAERGEWLIGVVWHKRANKFQAQVQNPVTKKQEHLGLFVNEIEAHNAWLKRKLELAHLLAAEQTDERVAKALIMRDTDYHQV